LLRQRLERVSADGYAQTDGGGENEGGDRHSPAAAAGSNEAERLSVEAGPRRSLPKGLLLRLVSVCRDEGERERRSNREGLRGSASVWSKRERFTLRSSSPMLEGVLCQVRR
jgi:hypothetical protein